MKNYVQSKLKRSKKIAFGHGGDEKKKAKQRAIDIQANADQLADQFTRLVPPYANDNLASFAALESIDLISEGPIEGFVDEHGKPCNPLRGSYLNDVAILEKETSKSYSAHFFSGYDCFQGCFVDTTGKELEILDEYSGFIDDLYDDKEEITDGERLMPATGYTVGSWNRNPHTVTKYYYNDVLNDTLNSNIRTYYIYFNGVNIDNTPTVPSYHFPTEANTRRVAGRGYTRSPFAIQSIFGQDEAYDLNDTSGMPIIGSEGYHNEYTFDRPVRFLANVIYKNGIDRFGQATKAICTRAFFQNIISLRSGTASRPLNDTTWGNLTSYVDRGVQLLNTTWDSGVDGDRPYERITFSVDPTTAEPEGFKEPVFENITRLKNIITGNFYPTPKNYGYLLFRADKLPFSTFHETNFPFTGLKGRFVGGVFQPSDVIQTVDYLSITGVPENFQRDRNGPTTISKNWYEFDFFNPGLIGDQEYNFSLNASKRSNYYDYKDRGVRERYSDRKLFERNISSSITTTQKSTERPSGMDIFNPFAQGGKKQPIGHLTHFEAFRSISQEAEPESVVAETKFWPLSDKGRVGYFPGIAVSAEWEYFEGDYRPGDVEKYRIITRNDPGTTSKLVGTYKWPVYLGPNFEACDDNGNPDLNKIIVLETDSNETRENKIQSGRDLNYDVFDLVEDDIVFSLMGNTFVDKDFTTGLMIRFFDDYNSDSNGGIVDPLNLDSKVTGSGLQQVKAPFDHNSSDEGFFPGVGGFAGSIKSGYSKGMINHYNFVQDDIYYSNLSDNSPRFFSEAFGFFRAPISGNYKIGTRNKQTEVMSHGLDALIPQIDSGNPGGKISSDIKIWTGDKAIRNFNTGNVDYHEFHDEPGNPYPDPFDLPNLNSGQMVPMRIQFSFTGVDSASIFDFKEAEQYYGNLVWAIEYTNTNSDYPPTGDYYMYNDYFQGTWYSYTGVTGVSDEDYFDQRTGDWWEIATGLANQYVDSSDADRSHPHIPISPAFLGNVLNDTGVIVAGNLRPNEIGGVGYLAGGMAGTAKVFKYLNVGNNTSNLTESEILGRTLGVTVEQKNHRSVIRHGDNTLNRRADDFAPGFNSEYFGRYINGVNISDSVSDSVYSLGGAFNYQNVSVEFRNGEEQQDSLKTKSITDFFIQKNLVGPYNPNQTYGSTYLTGTGVEGYFDPDNTLVTGISGVQFDGQWDETVSDFINDISNNTVQLRWVRDNIFYPDDSLISNDTTFTIEVAGFIYVENTSNYEFRLNSDDRSKVWIGESAESGKFNDNNYLVTAYHPDQVIGYTGLAGGVYYPIRYIGENGSGPYEFKLDFRVSGSSDSYESVTGFYHKPNGAHPLMTDSLISGSGYLIETNVDERGRIKYGASEGTASEDARFGRNYSNWLAETPLDSDDNVVKHVIYRKEVDSIIAGFLIDSLFSTQIFDNDVYNVQVNRNKAVLNIEVELGFEGLEEGIFTPTKTVQTYEGSVSSQYAVDQEYTLPKYSEIIDSFEGETTISLNEKYPRYVRFKKLDFETNSTLISRSVSVFKVSEIVNCDFSYPNSAVVKFQTDARTFNNIPTRTYSMRLKKILVPSNYFPLNSLGRDKRYIDTLSNNRYFYMDGQEANRQVYIGDWDGSFKLAWSDNPAWVLYDLLINDRYGIASRLDDLEDIDIYNLYKIGKYCDAVDTEGRFVGVPNDKGGLEPRFSCNVLLDGRENAFKTINSIASIFNGMAFWSNGTINFFADQPKDVSALFNNQNVFDGLFQYEDTLKNSRFNTIEVQFLDKDNDFKIKSEFVEDEESIRKNGIIKKTINAKGTTSRSQARRLGRYILYTNKNETEIVRFKTDPQALLLNIGDIFEVEDEIKNFEITASKIIGSNNNEETITVEKTFNTGSILTGDGNPISVYSPTGQTTKKELDNITSTGGKITEAQLTDYNKSSVRELIITGLTEETDGIKLNVQTSFQKNACRSLRVSGVNDYGGPADLRVPKFSSLNESKRKGADLFYFYEIKFMAKGDIPFPRNPLELSTGQFGQSQGIISNPHITGATGSIYGFTNRNPDEGEGMIAFALSGTSHMLSTQSNEDGQIEYGITGSHAAWKSRHGAGITNYEDSVELSANSSGEFKHSGNGWVQYDFYDDDNSSITKTEITGIYFHPGVHGANEDIFDFLGGPFTAGGTGLNERARTTQFLISETTGFDKSEHIRVGFEFVIDENTHTGRWELVKNWITGTHGSLSYQDRTGEDGNLTGLIPLPLGQRAILRRDLSIDYEDIPYERFEDYNNPNLDLIESGSYTSFSLKNTQPQLYKTMAIDHEENNLYSVMGVFHDTGKFEAIETQDFDFKYQFTGYNIGIPEGGTNQITEPSGFTTTSEQLESENIINFKISGDPQGNESSYLINVIYPNGRRNQKRVLKGTATENGYIITSGSITELDSYGTFKLTVESEKR